jgi:hypothetical protein
VLQGLPSRGQRTFGKKPLRYPLLLVLFCPAAAPPCHRHSTALQVSAARHSCWQEIAGCPTRLMMCCQWPADLPTRSLPAAVVSRGRLSPPAPQPSSRPPPPRRPTAAKRRLRGLAAGAPMPRPSYVANGATPAHSSSCVHLRPPPVKGGEGQKGGPLLRWGMEAPLLLLRPPLWLLPTFKAEKHAGERATAMASGDEASLDRASCTSDGRLCPPLVRRQQLPRSPDSLSGASRGP